MKIFIYRSILYGTMAGLLLLSFYIALLTAISGLVFAKAELAQNWPYILALDVGFGLQVALYVQLRSVAAGRGGGGRMLGVTGTTSALSMVSCCAHYVLNILPILGVVGAVSFVAAYQRDILWFGIAANLGGLLFIGRRFFIVLRSGPVGPSLSSLRYGE